jgi:hypothetical protein
MAFKRLFWFFDLHGGAVGIIPLGAGSARTDDLFVPSGFLMQLDLVTSAGSALFDFGTVAEPTLLTAGWAPGDLVTNAPRTILSGGFEFSLGPSVNSPWAIQITGADLTAGVLEVWFQTVRRT